MKSIAFREQVLAYRSEGHTVSATAKKFGIYETTVYEWKKRLKTNGHLEPTHRVYLRKPKRKHIDIIPPEELKKYVAENPYAFQWEIAAHFKCSRQAVCLALKREDIKRKKRRKNPLDSLLVGR